MSARIDASWSYEGLHCIRLENRAIALDLLPELGGKILHLIDKRGDRDVLWHSPRVRPHRAALHASFDDHWAGGWDDVFPGGAPSSNRYGDVIPYLGELWTQASEWRIERAGPAAVELVQWVDTPITPARWERRITLEGDDPVVRIAYRIENTGTLPFDWMLGLHPAQALTSHHRLDVPARRGEVDEAGGGTLGTTGETYRWPRLGEVDLRVPLAADAGTFALHYLTELEDGWIASTDTETSRGFGLSFDRAFFPVVWAWLVYGGWRGYHHAILEPWTGYPSTLAGAVAAGRARVLAPGEQAATEVSAVIYSGVRSVASLAADGSVRA